MTSLAVNFKRRRCKETRLFYVFSYMIEAVEDMCWFPDYFDVRLSAFVAAQHYRGVHRHNIEIVPRLCFSHLVLT
jgi:hypothetical protein